MLMSAYPVIHKRPVVRPSPEKIVEDSVYAEDLALYRVQILL